MNTMRVPVFRLAPVAMLGLCLCACGSDSSGRGSPDAAIPSPDGGHSSDASSEGDNSSDAISEGGSAIDASVDSAAQGDAQTGTSVRCNVPLDCSRMACRKYQPLAQCPVNGQVREGFCGFGDELRLRISFDGGGEFIQYWDVASGKLVAIDHGSDLAEFCGGTSARILIGDLKRIEACEASRSEQKIICDGANDDAGTDDAG